MDYEDYKFPRVTTFKCWKCGKRAVAGASNDPLGEPKTNEWCEEHKPSLPKEAEHEIKETNKGST